MDKQKVVVVLLVIAIVLSGINLFMNAGFDPVGGFSEVMQGGQQTVHGAGSGQVGITVLEGAE